MSKDYVTTYGAALAVTAMPLLAIEYISWTATGEHFVINLSGLELREMSFGLGFSALFHIPIGYALGKFSTESVEKKI